MHNRVKIIAGKWRGTNLQVVDAKGVRPTGARLRETLFNWLMPFVEGATCLDLFAGSGALGLEALSRGAASCVFVDILPKNIANISALKKRLGAENILLYRQDFSDFLRQKNQNFSIIFLDPPFDEEILPRALHQLGAQNFLQAEFIYTEFDATKRQWLFAPKGFAVYKEAQLGETQALLFKKLAT